MIGLIQIDGKLPNLALMKVSTYFKAMGEEVEFVEQGKDYEIIYASALFSSSLEEPCWLVYSSSTSRRRMFRICSIVNSNRIHLQQRRYVFLLNGKYPSS